jgi:hypothetical protein
MISCATSAEPLVPLKIKNLQSSRKLTAGAACNSNLDHFSGQKLCFDLAT